MRQLTNFKQYNNSVNRFLLLVVIVFVIPLFVNCAKQGLIEGEGYVNVTGGKVWYKIVGSGNATPLLLLHGGPGATSDYLKPLEMLADERPVIFYDQLGSGKSDRPNDQTLWRIERFVEELVQLRKSLGLKQVHILGHSWGTMLAVDYMLTKPSGVLSLILASPCLSSPKWIEDANIYRANLPKDLQEVLNKHEEAGTTDSEEYQNASMEYYRRHLCRLDPWPVELENTFSQLNMDVYGTMWGSSEFYATGTLKDYDRTGQLNKITVPTLFTAGRYDESTPETTTWYQSFVPNSKIVIIEDASHMTMLEQPEKYVKIVRDFLNSIEN